MENLVIYRDRQELQAADLNNSQIFARDSIDHIVNDAVVNASPAYWGFGVTKTAATQVTIAPGRYYSGIGSIYPIGINTVLDLFNNLPLVTQKYVAIVTWGTDVQLDVQPRDIQIDATTGVTEPQSVAMKSSRAGNLAVVAGVESPQPSFPSTDSTVTVVAYILLNTTGVVSIQQFIDTQLRNLKRTTDSVDDIEVWRNQVSGQIDSLNTALTNLANRLKGYATEDEMQASTKRLDELINYVYGTRGPVNNSYIFYGKDRFLDTSLSDTGNGSWSAKILEGIQFPDGASATTTLALLNSLDPNAAVNSGYLIPSYSNALRIKCGGYSSELQISTLTFQSSVGCRQLHRRRRRQRFGCLYQPNRSSDWWKVGGYDPVKVNLAFDSETFATVSIEQYIQTVNPLDPWTNIGSYLGSRLGFFWQDLYSECYWDRVVTNVTVSGQQFSQVFLNAQDGWLTQVGAHFSRLGASGDVDVKICHVNSSNAPDLDNVISTTTVPFADLRTGSVFVGGGPNSLGLPVLVETKIPIQPTFLASGKRYAVVMTTAGQHYHALTVVDALVLQGNHWYCDSTGVWVVDVTRNLRLNLYYAKFASTRYDIPLQPLQLAGGITNIDVLAEMEVPSATSLALQVQLNNKWYPLDKQGIGPDLSTDPALLPLKAVFTGTTDLMPGLGLTASQVKLSRPATTFDFFSTATSLGTRSGNIKITTVLGSFDAGHHTCVTKVHENGNTHTADSVADTTLPDGSIQRDSTFSLGGAKASGTVTFTGQPTNTQTLTIGGTVVTFVSGTPTGNQVKIAATTLADTLIALGAFLNTSMDASLRQASYVISPTVLTVTHKVIGTVGNSYGLATTVTGATVSAATLAGGLSSTLVSSYAVEILGTTDSANAPFHVSEKDEYAM